MNHQLPFTFLEEFYSGLWGWMSEHSGFQRDFAMLATSFD
jgi:hypothetical protein